MFRRLYDWMMKMAEHPKAIWAMSGVSFVESSFFPLPPDIMLIPMVLAKRHKAFIYALAATIASVLGGILGYLIGALLFDVIGQPLLDFYGYGGKFSEFAEKYNKWGVWVVLFAGLTPFPYKVITIASGATGLGFPVFLLASIVARSIRFYAVCGLLYVFGSANPQLYRKIFRTCNPGLFYYAVCRLCAHQTGFLSASHRKPPHVRKTGQSAAHL